MKAKTLVKAAAIGTGAVAGVSFALFNETLNSQAKLFNAVRDSVSDKKGIQLVKPDKKDERKIWFNSCDFKEYSITNPAGHTLKGSLIPSETGSDVFVFCSHGYRSSGKFDFAYIAKFYHDLGYNVFMPDHRGHGSSEGKYIGFGYHESGDCLLWLDYLKQLFGEDIRFILHGVSMGSGTVTLMSGDAALPENVKFIVADCGYTSAWDEFKHDMKYVYLPAMPFLYGANIWNKIFNGFDFKDCSPIDSVKRAKVPMLFIHGDCDDFVPTYMVHQLYAAYEGEYKDLLLVKGAAHAESYLADSASYESKVKEFIDKFID